MYFLNVIFQYFPAVIMSKGKQIKKKRKNMIKSSFQLNSNEENSFLPCMQISEDEILIPLQKMNNLDESISTHYDTEQNLF